MTGKLLSHVTTPGTRRRRVTTFLPVILIAALISVGCQKGPALVNAGGTVEYDGKPVPDASITFVPDGEGRPAVATSDKQGKFSVMTEGKPGALAGSYKVTISAARQIKQYSVQEQMTLRPEQVEANTEYLVPTKYSNPVTSGLTATVSDDPSKNVYAFKLEGPLDKKQ